ncbi:MAG TPA: FAD-dependent oxidoreductase [Candidatus Acidoferrales bacterium]|nr:FAD-dependent oxidoreductase [Candidatus Acidoferrales bacterium]
MARTFLTTLLQRAHAACAESQLSGLPVDIVAEEHRVRRLGRAEFLAGAASASAALLAACSSKPAQTIMRQAGAPRVVIVGGGLAGATCAYRLHKSGIPFTLCEANSAFGGRTWTLRNFFDDGQLVEHGGEFISSEHTALRNLCAELSLPLEDLRKAQLPGTEEVYYVKGQTYTWSEMLTDYAKIYPSIANAAKAAPFPTLYNRYTPAGLRFDRMSAREFIVSTIPGGLDSKIGWLMDLDCTTENGGEASDQSALEYIYMLGYMQALTTHSNQDFYLVGTDERYHVVGGNDQVVGKMIKRLPNAMVQPEHALVSLARQSDGSYNLTFKSAMQTVQMQADHVVLALPFTTLRQCDLTQAGFEPRKMLSINKLGMGTNTKMHVQFRDRLWYKLGYNGYTYADDGFQQTYEPSRHQAGAAGILTSYYGGDFGAKFKAPSFAPAFAPYVNDFLRGLEPIYPGSTAAYNLKSYMDYWTGDPWHHGSYSYGRVGQYTSFIGIEPVRQGNVHFCGEHCSIQFGGFMNGAVETGEAVAATIKKDLGMHAAA